LTFNGEYGVTSKKIELFLRIYEREHFLSGLGFCTYQGVKLLSEVAMKSSVSCDITPYFRAIPNEVHGVIFQKIELLIVSL
jgi:hypothetical protein